MSLAEQLAAYQAPASFLDGDAAHSQLEGPEHAAPGHPALLPSGVIYTADWYQPHDGLHRHVRESMLALALVGVPVRSHPVSTPAQLMLDPDVAGALGWTRHVSMSSAMYSIRHGFFSARSLHSTLITARRFLPPEKQDLVLGSTIVYTSWERDRVGPEMVELLNDCREVWVPCEANRAAFSNSGVERVHVIACPYQPDAKGPCSYAMPRATGRVPPGRRFYHIGKWEPRKDQANILQAFLRAFTPDDDAHLTIKTSEWGQWEGYPSIGATKTLCALDGVIRGNGWTSTSLAERVRIITQRLPESSLLGLHGWGNIYVSASHGEGWDLPAFDARCAGNRLVHVGYGGSEDYAGPDDVTVEHRMGPVHPEYRWEPGAQWAEYELDALVEALRSARPPEERIHPADFYPRFSRFAVGMHMRNRLGVDWQASYG